MDDKLADDAAATQYAIGYREGFDRGQIHGSEDGKQAGSEAGAKLGAELGLIYGLNFARSHIYRFTTSDYSEETINKSPHLKRIREWINSTSELLYELREFPHTNREDCEKRLLKIRSLSKKVDAQLQGLRLSMNMVYNQLYLNNLEDPSKSQHTSRQ